MKTIDDHLLNQRIEDAAFLADHGVGLTEAADRMGMVRATLRDYLNRHGRDDLAQTLAANDPVSA